VGDKKKSIHCQARGGSIKGKITGPTFCFGKNPQHPKDEGLRSIDEKREKDAKGIGIRRRKRETACQEEVRL